MIGYFWYITGTSKPKGSTYYNGDNVIAIVFWVQIVNMCRNIKTYKTKPKIDLNIVIFIFKFITQVKRAFFRCNTTLSNMEIKNKHLKFV